MPERDMSHGEAIHRRDLIAVELDKAQKRLEKDQALLPAIGSNVDLELEIRMLYEATGLIRAKELIESAQGMEEAARRRFAEIQRELSHEFPDIIYRGKI